MLDQTTCADTPSATSLLASEAGAKPCDSPAGPQTDLFGQALAPARALARPGKAKASTTTATYGRYLPPSSASAALQLSLASRLHQLFDLDGSIEYALTWKKLVTPSGATYFALLARAHRTSGSGCTGWPTPQSFDAVNGNTVEAWKNRQKVNPGMTGSSYPTDMSVCAQLAGWATPRSEDSEQTGASKLSGWGSPRSCDYKGSGPDGSKSHAHMLGRRYLCAQAVEASGQTPSGSPAAMAYQGASRLNPFFSAWVMGFPTAWTLAGLNALSRLPAKSSTGPRS